MSKITDAQRSELELIRQYECSDIDGERIELKRLGLIELRDDEPLRRWYLTTAGRAALAAARKETP